MERVDQLIVSLSSCAVLTDSERETVRMLVRLARAEVAIHGHNATMTNEEALATSEEYGAALAPFLPEPKP